MARSYASVARSSLREPPAPAPAPQAPAGPPSPLCHYCGSVADVCTECLRICSYSPQWGLQPVVAEGRCSEHTRSHESKAHAFYGVELAKYIPQTCSGCRAKHPWKPSDCLELKGFSYERMCLCHPLKSPNGGRFNVVFVGQRRYIPVGGAKSTPVQVSAWAQAAYEKEMEFSGETKRAEVMKQAILCGDPFVDIRYRMWEACAE